MGFLTFNVTDIISSLFKMGASISEGQLITLKWRLSPEGQKFYSQEQTNQFYEALRKGDTSVIDIVRKEKQEIIEKLEQELLLS